MSGLDVKTKAVFVTWEQGQGVSIPVGLSSILYHNSDLGVCLQNRSSKSSALRECAALRRHLARPGCVPVCSRIGISDNYVCLPFMRE